MTPGLDTSVLVRLLTGRPHDLALSVTFEKATAKLPKVLVLGP